jgi:hypothetical protein
LRESYHRSSSLSLSFSLASNLWEDIDASHAIAYSNEQVSNKNGSPIQVSKDSLHIFSARFTVMLESGIVKASVVVISPEITRILSKQCSLTPLTSQSLPTPSVDTMDILTSKAMIFSKQCSLTPPSMTTCNIDAMDILTSLCKHYSLTFQSQPTPSVAAMDIPTSITMILAKQ